MAGFCLMPAAVDKFKAGLISGKIDPAKLSEMTSEERNKFFEKYVGKSAPDVNALFESKLLLKNQQQGLTNWAKQVAGLKPAVQRDLISRIEKMDKVLDPENKQQFLGELARSKLGVSVTQDEAKNIADLAKQVAQAEVNRNADKSFNSLEARMNYGRAHYDLAKYVQDLTDNANKFKTGDIVSHPVASAAKLANLSRTLKTIGDLSISFRNGFKMMATHPSVWRKSFKTSFTSMFKTLGGQDAWREIQAYVRSSPYYNDMVKANLLPKSEEAYPTHISKKIPVLYRAANATQVGYEAMAQMMRVDGYTKVIQTAEKAGVDIADPKFKQDLGKFIGMLTNRGSIGKFERAGNVINAFLFSPRALASTLHLATDWARKDYDPYIRKQATVALVKVVGLVAGVMAIADAFIPGSVEKDPRSSDFGKVKIGDTRFDVSGGMSTVATLAARLYTGQTKSTTSGSVTSLTSGKMGSPTRMDEVTNFFMNKSAPAVSTLIAQLKGKDATGQSITLKSQLENAAVPLGIETYLNAKADKNSQNPNAFVTMLADDLGITANTYALSQSGSGDWSTSTSKELAQFKQKVGTQAFQQANNDYNTKLSQWQKSIVQNNQYKSLSPTDQASLQNAEKSKIKTSIFRQYGFHYHAPQSAAKKYKSLLNP